MAEQVSALLLTREEAFMLLKVWYSQGIDEPEWRSLGDKLEAQVSGWIPL